MFLIIKLSIFLLATKITTCSHLRSEPKYIKQVLERNNVVNKGVWVKNHNERFTEQSNGGDFIFRANSLDVDNIVQNNFDAFGDDGMQNSPGYFGYVPRGKRDVDYEKNSVQNNMKDCEDKDCIHKANDKSYVKSKLISKLKPASVFNDYPYEVAILLGDNNQDATTKIRKTKESRDLEKVPLAKKSETLKDNTNSLENNEFNIKNDTINVLTPKRSMKNEYESEVIKKIEITEDLRQLNGSSKVDRGIFDKDEQVWHQSLPNHDQVYKIGPKFPQNKIINERGLVKVLSMLTKTFKKIMKQHHDIKKIHNKLHNINDEVNKNVEEINKKYQDIGEKYLSILAVNEKIKEFELNLNMKEEYFKTKDREMAKNVVEFENQQKKFLIQQRQFYNIQKLMLAQNEKINIKQNMIAKTQSEISHRQNNFARILKKAKQIYIDNRFTTNRTPISTFKPVNETEEIIKNVQTTTPTPFTTESIKINLFSIPALNKLVNQDIQILKEKDEQTVDDLVYKYYFNNTYIDNLMKSKILSSFVTTAENTEIARHANNKRHNVIENTILLPINDFNKTSKLIRERRWIRHHHQSKAKLKNPPKSDVPNKFNDEKAVNGKGPLFQETDGNSVTKLFSKEQASPFLIMARSFCNEIGQNINEQMLNWCVEKSLRRLQVINSKFPIISPPPETSKRPPNIMTEKFTTLSTSTGTSQPPVTSTGSSTIPATAPTTSLTAAPLILAPTQASLVFFPDNDELELNLKQFDLKPDTEGNVYYDGSLHASDLGIVDNSDDFSETIPGLDSNSKIQVDSVAFDLQARRRNSVRRMNDNLLKKLYG